MTEHLNTEPYNLVDEPDLDSPVLILAMRGWVDAGLGMYTAIQAIVDQADTTTVAAFSTDSFIDYRARRPTLTLVDSINTHVQWPYIELLAGRDLDGRDLLILWGDEPDSQWLLFMGIVRDLAKRFGVSRAITIGAYPVAVPHTRPTQLTVTSTAEALIDTRTVLPGRIELPAGVSAAIERDLTEIGVPSLGLWVQVPHYAATLPYPAGAVTLLESLADRGPRRFEASAELRRSASVAVEQLDELTDASPERRQMLEDLERVHDSGHLGDSGSLPTGDDLAADFQRFLREHDPDS